MHLRASYSKIFLGEHAPTPLAQLCARFCVFTAQLYFSLSPTHREGESPYLEIYKLDALHRKKEIQLWQKNNVHNNYETDFSSNGICAFMFILGCLTHDMGKTSEYKHSCTDSIGANSYPDFL